MAGGQSKTILHIAHVTATKLLQKLCQFIRTCMYENMHENSSMRMIHLFHQPESCAIEIAHSDVTNSNNKFVIIYKKTTVILTAIAGKNCIL